MRKQLFEKMYNGVSSAKGFGDVDIPVNSNGYMVNPADHLPSDVLDKIKSIGDYQNPEVQQLLKQMPSQQAYDVAKRVLNVKSGTVVPCSEMDKLKIGSDNLPGTSAIGDTSSSGDSSSDSGSDSGGPDSAKGDASSDSGSTDTDAPDASDAGGASGGVSDGLSWFANNWETIAVAAGITTIIAATIRALSNTIKARFQKAAKVLTKMQKAFITKENGMDMKAILPGVGFKIVDWITRLWGGKKDNKGALGLYPFVDGYKSEIQADYKTAQDAFNKIKLSSESTDNDGNGPGGSGGNESFGRPVYRSFNEALNHGRPVNESVIAAISAGVALTNLAVKGGQWIMNRRKANGSGTEQVAIQVTKESTREVCFAIINNFLDKYVNVKDVSKKMGINVEDLGSIQKSDVDKFEQVIKGYDGKNNKSSVGMYSRIQESYNRMLGHYEKIGKKVISNFDQYTKIKSDASDRRKEKDELLKTAGMEKLTAAWEKQMEWLKNNFSHIITEIVSSNDYLAYYNFILEKVFPVFRTGLASDADYVLDSFPHKDQYYMLRQTGGQDVTLDQGAKQTKGAAVVQVTSFNDSSHKISFKMLGAIKQDYLDQFTDNSKMHLEYNNIDTEAYLDDNKKPKEMKDLEYKKWMALDPLPLDPEQIPDELKGETKPDADTTKDAIVYQRTKEVTINGTKVTVPEVMFAVPNTSERRSSEPPTKANMLNEADPQDKELTYNKIVYARAGKDGKIDSAEGSNIKVIATNPLTAEELDKLAALKSDDKTMNMGFTKIESEEEAKKVVDTITPKESQAVSKKAAKTEDIPIIINSEDDKDKSDNTEKVNAFTAGLAEGIIASVERTPSGEWAFKSQQAAGDTIELQGNAVKGVKLKKENGNKFTIIVPETIAALSDGTDNIAIDNFAFQDETKYTTESLMEDDATQAQPANSTNGAQQNPAATPQQGQASQQQGQAAQQQGNAQQPQQQGNNAQQNGQDEQNKKDDAAATITKAVESLAEIIDRLQKENKSLAPKLAEVLKEITDLKQKAASATDQTAPEIKKTLVQIATKVVTAVQNDPQIDEQKKKQEIANVQTAVGENVQPEAPKPLPAPVVTFTIDDGNTGKAQVQNTWDAKNVDAAIKELFKKVKDSQKLDLVVPNAEAVNSSLKVGYSVDTNLVESAKSTVSYKRRINSGLIPNPNDCYVLSECVWGNGLVKTPVKTLNESFRKVMHKCGTYSKIASYVKENKFAKIVPFSESMVVTAPKCQTGAMFTIGNPLYESLTLIKFDKNRNVQTVYRAGVYKITK
jgi:hypothetical protein